MLVSLAIASFSEGSIVQNLVVQAGDDPEVWASLRLAIPEHVLRHLGVIG